MTAPALQKHLLVVEDSDEDAMFLRRAVEQTGVSLPHSIVKDGDQAIAYLSGAHAFADRLLHPFPSMMLLDLKMPKKSGHDVLEWMKQSSLTGPKVIVYTSSAEPKDIDQAMRLGAFAYIIKPLSLGILARIVRELAAAMANPDHDHGLLGWHVRPLDQ